MLNKIEVLKEEVSAALKDLNPGAEMENFRVKYLGRKGVITELFKEIRNVDTEIRGEFGQKLNALKTWAEGEFDSLTGDGLSASTGVDSDITLPGYQIPMGARHPLTQTMDDIKNFFLSLGFTIADGPEIETDYYNFEALNLPKDHPARNMQDTLYITEDIVLRTHTSPVQIRVMESQQPPVQIIAPGRVYRRDTPDASHSPFFHQVEGLVVDRNISFRDLKGVIEAFAHFKSILKGSKARFKAFSARRNVKDTSTND